VAHRRDREVVQRVVVGALARHAAEAEATRSSPMCPCSHSQSNDWGSSPMPSRAAACANATGAASGNVSRAGGRRRRCP
jgi:hypothetical protein